MAAHAPKPNGKTTTAPEGGRAVTADQGGESPADLLDVALARRLCESSPLGIFLADTAGLCIYANAACEKITGLTLSQMRARPWDEWLHPQDRLHSSRLWLETVREDRPLQREVRICRPDSSIAWVRLHATRVRGESDTSQGSACLLMVEDVTARKAAEGSLQATEETLFQEKERAQVTLASIGDAVLVTDMANRVTYLNPEAERLTGWSGDAAVGRPLDEVFRILDGDTLEAARNPAQKAIEAGRTVGLELGCLLVRRDGSTLPIEDSAAPVKNRDGSLAGAVVVFHDAARCVVIAERNAHLAMHDPLTGLANTALLTERLTQGTALARRHRSRIGLLFIDLDGFKQVNDTYGHLAGDELLKAVASRLQDCVRAIDTVCRRGGDEFVIMLAALERRQDAGYVAEKVLGRLRDPFTVGDKDIRLSASIGISVYPENGEDAEALLCAADTAMYHAKEDAQGSFVFARPPPEPVISSIVMRSPAKKRPRHVRATGPSATDRTVRG